MPQSLAQAARQRAREQVEKADATEGYRDHQQLGHGGLGCEARMRGASKWGGGGGPLWPGANPLCPPVGEPFSAPGRLECEKIGWYLRLLSVGAQVSGSGDSWQGWGICWQLPEHGAELVGQVVVS